MTIHNARTYQVEAINAMEAALSQGGGALCQMATGCGKTFVMSQLARLAMARGRVMVIANRENLIFQLAAALRGWLGEEVDIEKAELKALEDGFYKRRIVVASVQTLISGAREGQPGRMGRFDPREFALLAVDECHHAMADSYLRIFHYFQSAHPAIQIAGFTATPERGDGKSLGLIYEHEAFQYPLPKAIDGGWLVPIRQRIARVNSVNLDDVKIAMGDLQDKQLQAVMSVPEAVRFVAAETLTLYGGEPSLLFSAGIEHGRQLCRAINALRPGSANEISSRNTDDERRAIMADFMEQRIPILIHHDIVSEGFDFPAISRIFNARPTKSRSRYAQAVGRATRPLVEGINALSDAEARKSAIAASVKPCADVVDFTGNCTKHNLAMVIDLQQATDNMDDRTRRRCMEILADGKWHDTAEVMEMAQQKVIQDQEEADRLELERAIQNLKTARFQGMLPFRTHTDYQIVNPFDLLGVKEPTPPPWNAQHAATEQQRATLKKWRLTDREIDTFSCHSASQMIARLAKRARSGLCTFRQAAALSRNGFDPAKATFEQASAILDKLYGGKNAANTKTG